jgi:toxin-antitoxin system PIN domain toxin
VVIADVNVLIYAYSSESPHHEASRQWLEAAFAGTERIGFAWVVLLAFLRITTSPFVMRPPLAMEESAAVVSAWLGREISVIVTPGRRHWQILDELLRESQSKGNLVNDAHLAALAIENGAALCSFDRDFRRFPKLRLIIPDATVIKR